MERKTLGCKLPACGWDSPAIDIQGCQLRHGACDSLQPQERKPGDDSTSCQPAQPAHPGPVPATQPLHEPHGIQTLPFQKNIFFPFSLSMETQNSNNNQKKKKKGPPSLLACKTMLGQGQGSGHHVGNKKGGGSQESLNRVLTGNFVMNRRSAHCISVGRFGWLVFFFFFPWLCVFSFSNLEGGLPRS